MARKVDVRIRDATLEDAAEIEAIYEYYVHHSTCTFQLKPDGVGAREEWFRARTERHPVVVAEVASNERWVVAAWGSLSAFRSREAYQRTVETSLYVSIDYTGLGLGRTILEHLLERARSTGAHCVIGAVAVEGEGRSGSAEGGQEQENHSHSGEVSFSDRSIALHLKYGFKQVGRLREVGHKFGRWLDVVMMQLML